jgi:excinuclease ABC subunit A
MGPEGGDKGGTVVAQGPPEAIVKVKASHTGKYLAPMLNGEGLLAMRRIMRNSDSSANKNGMINSQEIERELVNA